jgi:hypothetical protein
MGGVAIKTHRLTLDGSGNGSVNVPPCYYVGSKGTGGATITAADGPALGTAFLTRGTEIGCEGEIDVQGGTPSAVCELYFDYA